MIAVAPRPDSAASPPRFHELALDKGIVRRAVITALIVGSILNLIAQGDFLFEGQGLNWWKIALTYCVPYCVATYGGVSARIDAYKRGGWQ